VKAAGNAAQNVLAEAIVRQVEQQAAR